jgi:hypothetical protein
MAIIVDFIKEYAAWVYGVCALVALWYLRVVLLARRERRYAVFTLEREAALNRVYSSWGVAFMLILLMGLVYVLSTVVADAVRPLVEAGEPTHTPTLLAASAYGTPTTTPTLPTTELTPETPTTPTKRPPPTARPSRTPVPTKDEPPTEAAPAVRRPNCPTGNAIITSPGVGQSVSGMVPIVGTAVHDSFQFYKLEYGAGPNPGVWSYFDGGDRQVQNGQLGTLNAGALPPGTYSVRVVVVDTSGNFPPPCQTVVEIR